MTRNALGKAAAVAAFLVVGLGPLASPAWRASGPGRGPDHALGAVARAQDPPPSEVKEARGDWADLAGRWDAVGIEVSGREVEPTEAGFNECLILAPKPDVKTGTESVGWLILLLDNSLFCELAVHGRDLDATPKTLDLFTVRDIPAGKAGKPVDGPTDYEAIFRLVGDELTVCLGKPNGARPRDFSAGDGSGQTLIKFRRRPAEAKPPKADPDGRS